MQENTFKSGMVTIGIACALLLVIRAYQSKLDGFDILWVMFSAVFIAVYGLLHRKDKEESKKLLPLGIEVKELIPEAGKISENELDKEKKHAAAVRETGVSTESSGYYINNKYEFAGPPYIVTKGLYSWDSSDSSDCCGGAGGGCDPSD